MSKRNMCQVDEVPADLPVRAERSYYPWKDMVLGDTFFVPIEKEESFNSCRQNVYAANRRAASRGLPNRYACGRVMSETDPKVLLGMRVKRID